MRLTSISVLEVSLFRVIGCVDDRQDALVKVFGIGIGLDIVGRGEVVVGAHFGVATAAATLEPGTALRVLGTGSIGNRGYGDVLIAIQRGLDPGAIGEDLDGAGGRVQALEEDECRALQDDVDGSGNVELRRDSRVAADGPQLEVGVRVDIPAAVVSARRVHLVSAQRREVDRLPGLGGTVTVAVEDVDAQHILGLDEGQHREGEEELGEHDERLYLSRR